jgi:pentatricopeptide repeat protein
MLSAFLKSPIAFYQQVRSLPNCVHIQSLQREFHACTIILKRRDGASGAIVKTPRVFKKKMTKQEKKKVGISRPHKDHVTRMRELKSQANYLAKKEAAFTAFQEDEEMIRLYDQAHDEIINAGRYREYEYEDEVGVTLLDVDPEDFAAKYYAIPHEKQTPDDAAEVIRAFAVHGRVQDTERILHQLETAALSNERSSVLSSENVNNREKDIVPTQGREQMLSPTLVPNERCYMYHISALAKAREAAKAVRVMGRMKEKGIQPTQMTYNAVMQACARAHRPDWAYNV